FPLRPPLRSTLFPYTTLFRSDQAPIGLVQRDAYLHVQLASGVGVCFAHLLWQTFDADVIVGENERVMHEVLELAHISGPAVRPQDRKSTRLNSSHVAISYAVF